MCSFDGENLFDSGPCRFHFGGRELRHRLETPFDTDGAALRTDGRSARRIQQAGTLIADTAAQLDALRRAIEGKLAGRGAVLVDHAGVAHEHVAMIRFEPGAARRVGPRWAVDYTIDYVQTLPDSQEAQA